MSKNRRKTVHDGALNASSVARLDSGAGDPIARIVQGLALALLIVRWLIPTESAEAGDTLWIVELWFAAVLLWVWGRIRSRNFTLRASALDAAIWTLVAGHVVSALLVFHWGGNRRAAVNMAWEWVGLGTTFFLLGQVVRDSVDAKRLGSILAALTVVLAGFGVWQHWVFYPQAYAEYRKMLDEVDTLRKDPVANARAISDLEYKMQVNGIPNDEMARKQYENRLRFSNEAFGPFALANTFGGFLLVGLVITGELFRTARRPLSIPVAAAWGGIFLLAVYCLVLTKSRTAWVGLLVALAAWSGLSILRNRKLPGRRAIVTVVIGLGVVAVLFAVAAASGGFDAQVISESKKSLGYRLQYWRGALGVIGEHPLFGVGPGNFRQHYLAHKLPEASEEIADPHNLILDLWASGGLLALAGFAGSLLLAARQLLVRRASQAQGPDREDPQVLPSSTFGLAGGVFGFLLAVIAPVVSASGDFEPTALILLIGWLLAFAFLVRNEGTRPLSSSMLCGAAIGLLVHLLGAGGIEMPAVVQLFLVLAVLSFARNHSSRELTSPAAICGVGIAAFVFFFCCIMTATRPVLSRHALVSFGDQAIVRDGNFRQGIAHFLEAATKDPLSPEPSTKLAEAYFARWQSAPAQDDRDFEKAERALGIAQQLDPRNPGLWQRLGEMYLAKFARTRDPRDAQTAVDALAEAEQRYPNESTLRARRAAALLDAGHPAEAKTEAEKALELDRINHDQAHTDRYLPDATVAALRKIAARPSR